MLILVRSINCLSKEAIKLIIKTISVGELKPLSENMFGKLVEAVVDIDREIIAIDAELHVDLEDLLLENESSQDNLCHQRVRSFERRQDSVRMVPVGMRVLLL
jgi:hypothetical protein